MQSSLPGCKDEGVPGEGRIGCDTDILQVKMSFQEVDVLPLAAAEIRDIGRSKRELDARPVSPGFSAGNRLEAVFSFGGLEQNGCHLQEEGRFHERPEGRVKRPRDDGPRLFQFPGGLETKTDDGNPRRSQFFKGIFTEIDRVVQAKGKITSFPKGLGEGCVPQDQRRVDPNHVGAKGDHTDDCLGEPVGAVPRQAGHQVKARFEAPVLQQV